MTQIRQELPVLALGLSLYFSVGLISEELSLMCVGLFYGVLGSRSRRHLIGVVSLRSILTVMRSFYSMQVMYTTITSVLGVGKGALYNISLPSVGLNIPDSVSNIVAPEWVYIAASIVLLVIMIAIVILTLPIIVMQMVQYVSMFIVFYIGTPIFYPGTTMWQLMAKIQATEDPAVMLELIRPFVPWLFVTTYIFYVVGIPTLTYLYLKWIGFYKRIPGVVE